MPPIRYAEHPSEDALEEYAFDRLPESETAPLEEHLLLCPACQDRLRDVDEYINLMKAATSLKPRHRIPAWGVWAAAAALCACALLAVLLVLPHAPGAKPAQVELLAFRGGLEMAHATAGRRLDLAIDLSDLSPSAAYRVQVVDAAGRQEWSGSAAASGTKLVVHVSKSLGRGVHWVRLSSAEGVLLREFGLRAE